MSKKNKNHKNKHDKQLNSQTTEYIKDTSPVVPQRGKLKSEIHVYNRSDLTENQKRFLKLANDKEVKVIFISGPAGTSKTFLSVLASLQLLNDKKVSDLIYLRSVVESSSTKIGHLPGTIEEKVSVYLQPLMDKLEEILSKSDREILLKEQRIWGMPLNFLRGVNWAVKAIICDESQNMTYKEILTLITRVSEHSKLFILGDPNQSDINGNSGFVKMMDIFDDEESRKNGIFTFKFDTNDIVRSGLCRYIIEKIDRDIPKPQKN